MGERGRKEVPQATVNDEMGEERGRGCSWATVLERGRALTRGRARNCPEMAPETTLMAARGTWEEGWLALTGLQEKWALSSVTGKEHWVEGGAGADDGPPEPADQGQVRGLRVELGPFLSGKGRRDGKLRWRAAHWAPSYWSTERRALADRPGELNPELRLGLADRTPDLLCSARS